MSIIFLRLLDNPTKEETLLELRKLVNSPKNSPILSKRVFVKPDDFSEPIPNKPYSYWTPSRVITAFKYLASIEAWCQDSGVGIQTGYDERFLRLWWEVPSNKMFMLGIDYKSNSEAEIQSYASQNILEGSIWVPYFKGGRYSPFLLEPHLVINWKKLGSEINATGKGSAPNQQLYFLPGISFLRRTSIRLCATYLPAGCLFGNVSPTLQPYGDKFWTLLAILNSHAGEMLLSPFQTRGSAGDDQTKVYELGFVLQLPVPATVNVNLDSAVISLNYSILKILQSNETSRHFLCPSTLDTEDLVAQLVDLETETTDLYGWEISDLVNTETLQPYTDHDLEEEIRHGLHVSLIPRSSNTNLISRFSYGLGCVLGRWNVLSIPIEDGSANRDLLAPPRICPPGMLQNIDGLPAAAEDVPADYPIRISWSGILVDETGHPEDIVGRVREALHVIWGDKADDIEAEACDKLAVESLHGYFGNPNHFFNDHLSLYSKSRRYAPIYWPLTTTNGSYTLWLYYHRLDASTLYQCVNDFVDPKLAVVQRQMVSLRNRDRNRDEERDLERLTDLGIELEAFRKDLLDLARFWRPNLNDGVEITAAPLYALFGNRKWRNRLEKTWGKLQEGDYDWAHLAMSIWPERVVPKCTEDRSLAIAHDVEDLFWVEDEGSWRQLGTQDEEVKGQIARRQTSQHDRLRQHLEALANGAGKGIPAYQVWQHLSEGDWDDTDVALSLWPERAGEKHWDNPFQAGNLSVKMPTKRTKTNRNRFLKRLLEEGTPELVDAVAAAFENEDEAFDAVWQALVRGAQDEQDLALALWPERVVNKCVANVEMVEHHDLQRYFWYRPENGAWRPRKTQAEEIKAEIKRRQGGQGG